ncbi:MAG: TIGR00725 family protein [Candidatus Heimdallarchaeota archaeon]|nr:MAG: TIGR00725 family protein [Candidatus Heimdallarchaeota archaeon]
MKQKNAIQIGLIGDSHIRSEHQYNICYEIGKEIAQARAILICGGRGGVMEAACKGVYDSGGISVGILPTNERDPEVNEYITIKIPTFLHWARNVLVPLASDGVIACAGGAGTLSELSFTWMSEKPLVCITSIPGWSQEIGERGFIDHRNTSAIIITAETGKSAVKKALTAISRFKQRK